MAIEGNKKGRLIMVLSPTKTLNLTPLSDREFLHPTSDTSDDDCEGEERESDNTVDAASIIALSKKYSRMQQYSDGIDSAIDSRRRLCCREMTEAIVEIMKKKSVGELKQLLSLSENLAGTAHKFWSEFDVQKEMNENCDNCVKPAIFTFSGPAFQGLSPHTCNHSTLTNMASNLFVIDPVYGVLRALDGIQPYRLEMGCRGLFHSSGNSTANKNDRKESLSSYWKESVTSFLASELQLSTSHMSDEAISYNSKEKGDQIEEKTAENEGNKLNDNDDDQKILVNLASEEYSSSINPSSLSSKTIFLNVIFRHKGRVISVHSKRARGLMARYLSERSAATLKDVSEFDLEGYACVRFNSSVKKENERKDVNPGMDGQFWETVDVVGDDVKIVQMIFDRDDIPVGGRLVGKRSSSSTTRNRKKIRC